MSFTNVANPLFLFFLPLHRTFQGCPASRQQAAAQRRRSRRRFVTSNHGSPLCLSVSNERVCRRPHTHTHTHTWAPGVWQADGKCKEHHGKLSPVKRVFFRVRCRKNPPELIWRERLLILIISVRYYSFGSDWMLLIDKECTYVRFNLIYVIEHDCIAYVCLWAAGGFGSVNKKVQEISPSS